MSSVVTPPHLLFTDIDGSPLNEGFIFIGEDQKDPVSFPINVYWDEALTDVATQPISTKNGYIVKEGVKSPIFTESNKFSVCVKNRSLYLIYQELSFESFVKKNAVQVWIDEAVNPVNTAVNNEVMRATNAEAVLNNLISAETSRAIAAENAIGVGNKAYLTYAEMDAEKATIPPNSKVTVTSDPDLSKRGDWQWNGTIFTKSPYDPVNQAKIYTDQQVEAAQVETLDTIGKSLNTMSIYMGDNDLVPLAAGNNASILAYSKSKQKVVGLGIQDSDFYKAYANVASSEIYIGDNDLIPIQVGQNGGIALAWSKSKGKIVGLVSGDDKPVVVELNQMVMYGQSLSRGFLGTPVLSTTQPQNNLALTGGSHPTGFTSLVPLFENDMESPCSGAANYAAYLARKENGLNHQIVASTAGVNDALLSALSKGTSAYSTMLSHIQAVSNLKAEKSHAVQAFCWLQGESNLRDLIALDTYETDLKTLFENMKRDAVAITGQAVEPKVITYQLSTRIAKSEVVCKTQLKFCKEKLTAISTPTYHLPYNADGVHLTNVGYKWIGEYFGRAYKQYIVENRHPDYLEPVSAELVGSKIIVAFNVPKGPLVFDTTTLAATQDHGFAVKSGTSLLPIIGLEAKENTVEITLASPPSLTNLSVRYGLDYMAASKVITDGKSGNLRDSTPDTVTISGSEKPLFHVCPHFELSVISGAI